MINLVNNASCDGPVRAFVQTSANSAINNDPTVTDKAVSFTTVNMRNQAQTHQVEVELTGTGTHLVTLGFDDGGGTNPDSDADGLPDAWELENFGNLGRDGTGDFDSDGLTDREEYIVGSNPTNAASGFPALVVDSTGDTFRVEFPTVAGRVYTVMARTSLTSGDWTAVTQFVDGQANPVTGDGTTKTVTETGLGSTPGRFYRVQVGLAP